MGFNSAFKGLKYMRCIETQTNNTGFEKCLRDITGAHRQTHTQTHEKTNKQTNKQHGISQHTFFFSLESCLKIWGRQRLSAYLSVVIITHTFICPLS